MAEPWKCCSQCRCPCKNNDLCPDTAAHIISEGKQNIFDSIPKSNGNGSHSPHSPSLDDLIRLEQRIDERLKRMPDLSDPNHSHHESDVVSVSSSDGRRTPTDGEIYFNEILILRKRLQEAELRNAIVAEKVERLEGSRNQSNRVSVQQLNHLKQQIIAFIDEKFSQLLQNNN